MYTISYFENMATVSVRLEKAILQDLTRVERNWQTDRSEAVRRLLVSALKEWKIKTALERVAAHRISVGKAAEECEISLWEMLDILKQKNIDWTGYSKEDLEKDIAFLS